MFNFFDEIKSKSQEQLHDFNIVNMSGKLVYVEGHLGLTVLSENLISFKIKSGRIVIEGENLFLSELTNNTLIIKGKIIKTEHF